MVDKLSGAFVKAVKKYTEVGRRMSLDTVFFTDDGMYTMNDFSIILYNVFSDPRGIEKTDVVPLLEVKDGTRFMEKTGCKVVDPYMKEMEWEYDGGTETSLNEIKGWLKAKCEELGVTARQLANFIEASDKCNAAICINGDYPYWVSPDLLLRMASAMCVGRSELKIFTPKNRRNPLVLRVENGYGTHYGFLLGVMKNTGQ